MDYFRAFIIGGGICVIGKMKGKDDHLIGSPIITKALRELISRSGTKEYEEE